MVMIGVVSSSIREDVADDNFSLIIVSAMLVVEEKRGLLWYLLLLELNETAPVRSSGEEIILELVFRSRGCTEKACVISWVPSNSMKRSAIVALSRLVFSAIFLLWSLIVFFCMTLYVLWCCLFMFFELLKCFFGNMVDFLIIQSVFFQSCFALTMSHHVFLL